MLKTKKRFLLIAFASILVLCGLTAMRSADKPPKEIPVTATFQDSGDRIGSDGLGPYIEGVDDVHAVIDARGDFDMDTDWYGGTRKVVERLLYLDFTSPASQYFNPPFLYGYDSAFMSTGVGDLPLMEIGLPVPSNLAVNFATAGRCWFIRFNPEKYPGSTKVLITRLSEDTWEIEARLTDIAQLLSYSGKGKLVLTNEGYFYMPFKVIVKKK
jgi:hypothetical protein